MASSELEDLREWIRKYTPYLLGVAQAFADGPDEAEDILQEVWIIAHRQGHKRRTGTPIGAWLHVVTLNEGRKRLRRRTRRRRLRELWAGDLEPAERITADRGVGAELVRSRLWRVVAKLPALQREVVLLRIVEEMSTREAAQALNRAEGTIKASLHRALRTLREELQGTDVDLLEG